MIGSFTTLYLSIISRKIVPKESLRVEKKENSVNNGMTSKNCLSLKVWVFLDPRSDMVAPIAPVSRLQDLLSTCYGDYKNQRSLSLSNF